MKHKKQQKYSILALLILSSPPIWANSANYIEAVTGKQSEVNLQSLYALKQWPTKKLYAAFEGGYGESKRWYTGIGLGLRKHLGDITWGGYTFAHYNQGNNPIKYGSINPGLEIFNAHWDGHFNVYLPIGRTHWVVQQGFADGFNDYHYLRYQGHKGYDRQLRKIARIAPGVDISLGWHPEAHNSLH
jgi:hypothetical protein